MSPSFTTNDLRYGALTYTEDFPDRYLTLPHGYSTSNLSDMFFFFDFREVILLSELISISSLFTPIECVIAIGTRKEMTRSNAWGVIAFVENKLPCGDLSPKEHPCDSMGETDSVFSPSETDPSVSIFIAKRCPFPTWTGGLRPIDLLVKPLSQASYFSHSMISRYVRN